MINAFDELQRLGPYNMDAANKVFGEWNKAWYAIAAEMGDYTTRSIAEGSRAFQQLMAVQSIDQAVAIQSGYAKRAYDEYVQQMTKIGTMYANMAKDVMKPIESPRAEH